MGVIIGPRGVNHKRLQDPPALAGCADACRAPRRGARARTSFGRGTHAVSVRGFGYHINARLPRASSYAIVIPPSAMRLYSLFRITQYLFPSPSLLYGHSAYEESMGLRILSDSFM